MQVFDADRLAARYGKERVIDGKLLYLAKMDWSPGSSARRGRAGAPCPGGAGEGAQVPRPRPRQHPLGRRRGGGRPGRRPHRHGRSRGRGLPRLPPPSEGPPGPGRAPGRLQQEQPGGRDELFDSRPEIPLKPADFAALEIGWDPKHEGLRRIAAALNLGLDSLVFLDDNPAEVSLVAQMLPEVKTVLLPPDPADFAAVLDRLPDFERTAVLPRTR